MRHVVDQFAAWQPHDRIGVISDTHGLLRPEALTALRGSALIIHAGDIGQPSVLKSLSTIAPVLAVRGNNDREPWAEGLPDLRTIHLGDIIIAVVHDLAWLPTDMHTTVVIAGHSHRPSIATRHGTCVLNPGSAGPRRFRLPVAVARLQIVGATPHASIVELACGASPVAPPRGHAATRRT